MTGTEPLPPHLERYHRQILLPTIGADGQERLGTARALVVGCGALGTSLADGLVRAGVGGLTIVDRDLVELTNLQRQVLFDEEDVQNGAPKALAAKRRLERINSDVDIVAHVDDFNHGNAERFGAGADVILDGLDNFETRYLLNDLAVYSGLPYVYAGAVGTTGMTMPVLPHPEHRAGAGGAVQWSVEQSTPCLRCMFPEAPPPGSTATCDTAGVLGPVVSIVAALQLVQTIKLLTNNIEALDRRLVSIDVWHAEQRGFDLGPSPHEGCPCCQDGRFDYLHGDTGQLATGLCGRNAVQISAPSATAINLPAMAHRLEPFGAFQYNEHLLRGTIDEERPEGTAIELTLFANGRAIIKGTSEVATARSIYARYVGS